MGIGLFVPPLGLGLYGTCLIVNVPVEVTIKPMLKYLGLPFIACSSSRLYRKLHYGALGCSDIELSRGVSSKRHPCPQL